jgi:GntR family histidine utilization transcriptional repressor
MTSLRRQARTHDHALHARIQIEIEQNVVSGRWPPGHRLPVEHELMRTYGCSRMTVSKALTALTAQGLLVRRRRAGTFVARPQSQSAVMEISDIAGEVAALGLSYRFETIERRSRRTRSREAAMLGEPLPERVLDISCRHFAGTMPFCFERRVINLEAVPEAADATFDTLAPGQWLVQKVPWVRAEHRVRAVSADRAVADQLQIEECTPCLKIERRTWNAVHVITAVTLIYPGDAHEIVARFSPSPRSDRN